MKSFIEIQSEAVLALNKLKKVKDEFGQQIAEAIIGRIASNNVNSTLRTDIEKSLTGYTAEEKVDILMSTIMRVASVEAKSNSAGITFSYGVVDEDLMPSRPKKKDISMDFLSTKKRR